MNQWFLQERCLARVLQLRNLGLEFPNGVVFGDPFWAFLRWDAGLLFCSLRHHDCGRVCLLVLRASADHSRLGDEEKEGALECSGARIK